LSIGQSAGPLRSYPTMPSDAASLQPSSKLVPRANTPPVTHCFNRPVFNCGAGACAIAAEAAKAGRKSLRRMMHEYHSAPSGATNENRGQMERFSNFARPRHRAKLLAMRALAALVLLAFAAFAQDAIVLKPARVFDGEASHDAWAVRVRAGRIES